MSYPRPFTKVHVPAGESGDWKVITFTVTEDDVLIENLRASMRGMQHRVIPAGAYTRLVCKGRGAIMSDTPAEAYENYAAYRNARGHVLLNGLGLGFVLQAILTKPEVESVTVVEISPDVIKLVGPTVTDGRVDIVEADAMKYRPPRGRRFGAVWHDIWDNICGDNLPAMKSLHRAYGRRTDWQGSWSRDLLRYV